MEILKLFLQYKSIKKSKEIKDILMDSSHALAKLLSPIKVGDFEFPHRIAMAALTRMRADPKTSVPNDLHVKYYS